VSEGQRERSWTADNLTLVVVLRAVARAHEFILSSVPGHNATQMGADGVDAVLLNGAVSGDNEVGGLTLETLGEGAVVGEMGLEPLGGLHRERSRIYALAISGITLVYRCAAFLQQSACKLLPLNFQVSACPGS